MNHDKILMTLLMTSFFFQHVIDLINAKNKLEYLSPRANRITFSAKIFPSLY